MARRTQCTTIGDLWDGVGFGGWFFGIFAILGIIWTIIQGALIAFSNPAVWATPVSVGIAGGILLATCIMAIGVLVHARNYFFDHRLLCINDNQCAVGKVIVIEHNADGDKSLDLLLAPATEETSAEDYQNNLWQSRDLIFHDDGSLDTRGWHLDPKRNRDESPITFGPNRLPFFHCEIEGTKLDTWIDALLAYLGVLMAIAAAAIAAAVIFTSLGPIGWVLWIAAALLLLLLAIFGIDIGLTSEDEASVDIDNLSEAVPDPMGPIVTDSSGNHIQNGDIVAIIGSHICDTGHNPTCWNEIHPVKGIARLRDLKFYMNVGTDTPSPQFIALCDALNRHVNDFGTVSQGLTHLEHPRMG